MRSPGCGPPCGTPSLSARARRCVRPLAGILEQKVGHEEMMVLLRRGHPAAARSRLKLQTYAGLDHVLVAPRGQPGGTVDRALEALGLARRVVLQVPHFAAAALIV